MQAEALEVVGPGYITRVCVRSGETDLRPTEESTDGALTIRLMFALLC